MKALRGSLVAAALAGAVLLTGYRGHGRSVADDRGDVGHRQDRQP